MKLNITTPMLVAGMKIYAENDGKKHPADIVTLIFEGMLKARSTCDEDPLRDAITRLCAENITGKLTIDEILDALGAAPSGERRRVETRIGYVMRGMVGWHRVRRMRDGVRGYSYRRQK